MPGLFTTIILVAAVSPPCRCFKPVTVSEQGREIPAWTSYRYLDTPAPAAWAGASACGRCGPLGPGPAAPRASRDDDGQRGA